MKRHMITDEWLRIRGGAAAGGSYRFFENGDPFEAIWCNMCAISMLLCVHLFSVFQA